MIYQYSVERPGLFTENGLILIMQIRANAESLGRVAGAFSADRAWSGCAGSSWQFIAALDYLCEQQVIREITSASCAAQHRIFVLVQQ